MTTSQPTSLTLPVFHEDAALTAAQLGYMNGRAKADAHDVVLGLFLELAENEGMTQALIAKRLGKKPEQVSRWLGAPGNWTLETLSNLLLAMGYEPEFQARKLSDLRQSNDYHPLADHEPIDAPNVQIRGVTSYELSELTNMKPAVRRSTLRNGYVSAS